MSKIIAFSGSNSKNSMNQKFVIAVGELAENHEVEVINLRDYPAPVYGIDLEVEEGFPSTMEALKAKFDSADGYIVSTPEHNGSTTAVLKNTIDWLSRMGGKVFQGKPTIFMSTSPGPRGGATALEQLVTTMPYAGANIVGHYSLGSFGEHYVDGVLSDAKKSELKPLVNSLIEAISNAESTKEKEIV